MISVKVKIPSATWYEFMRVCNEKNVSACDVLDKLLKQYTQQN